MLTLIYDSVCDTPVSIKLLYPKLNHYATLLSCPMLYRTRRLAAPTTAMIDNYMFFFRIPRTREWDRTEPNIGHEQPIER